MYLRADSGTLLLPKLNSISDVGGRTRVYVTDSTLDLPQLETIADVQLLLDTNGVINLVHDLGFGPASMSTLGSPINENIIGAPASGSLFNGPDLDMDACTGTVGEIDYGQKTTVELTNGTDLKVLMDVFTEGTSAITLDQSTLSVRHDLRPLWYGAPTLSAVNSSIFVGNFFQHDRTDVTHVALGDSTVTMDGTEGGPIQTLEVGGIDVSTVCGLLADDNFGFGQLVVGEPGSPSTTRLYDFFDNGHRGGLEGFDEALYLFGGGAGGRCSRSTDGLVIDAASVLELNCINTYVWDASATSFVPLDSLFTDCNDTSEVSMFGGTIRMLPEPGASVSLLAGAVLLCALRRRQGGPRRL